jgi:uncharacterized membrane protein
MHRLKSPFVRDIIEPALPAVLTFLSLVFVFLWLASGKGSWALVLVIIGAAAVTYTLLAYVARTLERDAPPQPINPKTSIRTMQVVVAGFAALAVAAILELIRSFG